MVFGSGYQLNRLDPERVQNRKTSDGILRGNVEGQTPLTVATVQQLIHNVRDELLEAFQQRAVQAPPDPLPAVASKSIPNSGREYASF